MKTRKTLSLLLVLAMLMSLFTVSAMATGTGYSLTPYDSNVTTLTLSGVSVKSHTVTTQSTGSSNVTQTYNVILAYGTATNATVDIDFTTPDSTAVSSVGLGNNPNQYIPMIGRYATDNYTVTLNNGVGTQTVYVHENFPNGYGNCDTYIFNFTISSTPTDDGGPVNIGNGAMVSFGDPAYPNTAPECYMELVAGNNGYTATYDGPTANYYPSVLSMYVTGTGITSMTGSGVQFAVYDAEGEKTSLTTITPAQNSYNGVASNLYTVEIGATGGTVTVLTGTGSATITFSAPQQPGSSGEAVSDRVNGYLPIGQFATGSGWGSASGKFGGGIESTGVSLGMLGGYIQFDLSDDPITNDADNKYGIDFVVYGNPFDGNPEAGSVMVYGKNTQTNTYGWYNLAGSRHYMADTNWDVDISYLRIGTDVYDAGQNYATIGSRQLTVGIYTATDYPYAAVENGTMTVSAAIAAADWSADPIIAGTGWWPDGYSIGDENVDGVYWHDNGATPVITYAGVTEVADSDITNDYLFGYADVRQAGSYGSVINPYASLPNSGTGGDGFDLSWAVDANGDPVSVTDVKYVRVYSAVLHNAGIFGETSTEVCGLYVVNGGGTGTAVAPTITIDDMTLSELEELGASITTTVVSDNQKIIEISDLSAVCEGEEITVAASGGNYVYINGAADENTVSIAEDAVVQIINQSGTAEPFITLLRLSA